MLAFLLVATYIGAVLYKVLSAPTLNFPYVYHPIMACAALGFAFLGIAQTQSIRGRKTQAQRESKVTLHSLGLWFGVLSFAAAVGSIYYNKELHNKPHGVSYHGKGGFFATLLFTLQAVGPTIIYNFNKLEFYKSINPHRVGGYIAALSGLGVHASAVWFGYTGYKQEQEKYALLGLLGASALALLWGARRPAIALDAAKKQV